ncbi:MAG: ABC transporter ATP-binding protein [Bacillaceae bacterium]
MLLNVQNLQTDIGQYHILHDVTFQAKAGEITVLLGRNGAGKTTTLKSIMGLLPAKQGSIQFKGEEIKQLPPHRICEKGIGYVPENQGIFGSLTVEENMKVAIKKKTVQTEERLEWILQLFPDLKTYWKKQGGYLSGGQKQMLAIARAYIQETDLLLIDEPSKGLAPIMIQKVIDSLHSIKEKRTIILVEQNFYMASQLGDCFYILDDGKTVHNGRMNELTENKDLRKRYLGIA